MHAFTGESEDFLRIVLELKRYAAKHYLPDPELVLPGEWRTFLIHHSHDWVKTSSAHPANDMPDAAAGVRIHWVAPR